MSELSAKPVATPPDVILICHGSRNPDANTAHRELCNQLGDAIGVKVWPAFLELEQPDLPAVVADLVGNGSTKIRVMPYFLHPGNHTSKDIPQLIAQALETHRGLDISIGELFGADPKLVSVLAAQADRVIG